MMMFKLISSIPSWRPSSRKVILATAGIAGGIAAVELFRRWWFSTTTSCHSREISRLPDELEAFNSLGTTILYLEKLLEELEKVKYSSDLQRNRYELILSILIRMKDAKSDFDKFRKNDFEVIKQNNTTTEEIARSLWYNEQRTPRASTLSVLSDDSFASAIDDFVDTGRMADDFIDSNSINLDFGELGDFYKEGVKQVVEKKVQVRKFRTEFCGCDSDDDFLAKVYCLRKAFDQIFLEEINRHWFIQQGRNVLSDLMLQDGKNPDEFLAAYDKFMDYLSDSNNSERTQKELELHKVEAVNIWDVLLDFILLYSFDDLKKPPTAISALFKNPFFSRSLKESTLNNLIWNVIKVKKQRLLDADGFISHFYDVSQVFTPILVYGFFGDGPKSFQELCFYLKESVNTFVAEIFNLHKVRYTSLDDLAEDVQRLLETRLEILHVKITNDLISE